jgi:serine/threonine protein kinase
LFSKYYSNIPETNALVFFVDETKRELLNWSKRLQIIKAIADGLAFLHGHSQMCIVHRDIKASNILLDHEMNAKITVLVLH